MPHDVFEEDAGTGGGGGSSSAPLAATTAARAWCSTTTGLASGYQVVPLDTVSYDLGSNLNLANHRYVVPTTGLYDVIGVIGQASSGAIAAGIFNNGVITSQNYEQNSFTAVITDTLELIAGDHIDLRAFSGITVAGAVGGVYLTVKQVA